MSSKKIFLPIFIVFFTSYGNANNLLSGQQNGISQSQSQLPLDTTIANPQTKNQATDAVKKFFIIGLNLFVKLPIEFVSKVFYLISLFAGLISTGIESLGNLIQKPEL